MCNLEIPIRGMLIGNDGQIVSSNGYGGICANRIRCIHGDRLITINTSIIITSDNEKVGAVMVSDNWPPTVEIGVNSNGTVYITSYSRFDRCCGSITLTRRSRRHNRTGNSYASSRSRRENNISCGRGRERDVSTRRAHREIARTSGNGTVGIGGCRSGDKGAVRINVSLNTSGPGDKKIIATE